MILERNLETIIQNSVEIAMFYNNDVLRLEHLFYGFIKSKEGSEFLIDFNIKDLEKLEKETINLVEKIPKIEIKNFIPDINEEVNNIINFLIQDSIENPNTDNKYLIKNLFSEIINSKNKDIYQVLLNNNFDLIEWEKNNNKIYLNENNNNNNNNNIFENEKNIINKNINNYKEDRKEELINKAEQQMMKDFTNNICDYVKENNIVVIERDEEILKSFKILSRKNKNNLIITGGNGVGKTSVLYGIADKINNNFNEKYENVKLLQLNTIKLFSGTKYKGELEDRIDRLFKIFEKENVILVLENINFVSNNDSSNSLSELWNLLKQYIIENKVKFIATISNDFIFKFEKDKFNEKYFEKIVIDEPNSETSFKIINKIKNIYEEEHKVFYSDEVIKEVIKLSKKYLFEKLLPESAISILDDIGSKNNIYKHENSEISMEDVYKIFHDITNLPGEIINSNETEMLLNLEKHLKDSIYGQDKAIEEITERIIVHMSGLLPSRTIGNFLFVGPTGSGKTELSKQLSKYLGLNLLRYDMSEFQEKHTVSKFIGSPPGYVGHQEGGQLIKDIKKNPNSIILLDEIEKAHSEVLNIFLQMMDYGVLTSSDGQKISLSNCIIIMTSNAGMVVEKTLGFDNEDNNNKAKIEINRFFSPEFRNRLDSIVHFNKISENVMLSIINKFISEYKYSIKDKNIDITFSDESLKLIADESYDNKNGARKIKRYIESNILNKIAKEIIFNSLKVKNNIINVVVDENNKFKLEIKNNVNLLELNKKIEE